MSDYCSSVHDPTRSEWPDESSHWGEAWLHGPYGGQPVVV
jgi:hypothetical protein